MRQKLLKFPLEFKNFEAFQVVRMRTQLSENSDFFQDLCFIVHYWSENQDQAVQ